MPPMRNTTGTIVSRAGQLSPGEVGSRPRLAVRAGGTLIMHPDQAPVAGQLQATVSIATWPFPSAR